MNARVRFGIAVVLLGLLMTAPFVLTVGVLYADLPEADRLAFRATMERWLPIGAMLTVVGFVFGLQLLRSLFQQYVRGLLAVAEKLRLMHGANRNFRVEAEGPPEVRQLIEAANVLAQQRDDLLTDVDARVAQAKAAVEEEKNRLAALVADLPEAERVAFRATMERWLPIGAMLTVVAFVFGLQLLRSLFQQYVRGLLAVAEKLRLMHGANRNFRVEAEGPPEVRQLIEAANVLAQVKRDGMAARGEDWPAEAEEQFKAPIRAQYEAQGHPFFAGARLWDDGLVDPAEARTTIALGLSAALNAPIEPTRFGIFRM